MLLNTGRSVLSGLLHHLGTWKRALESIPYRIFFLNSLARRGLYALKPPVLDFY